MPLIAKTGDLTQGHCWPPAPMESQFNPGVYVQGQLAIVEGDLTVHPGPCGDIDPHDVIALKGSPTVFINSIPVIRDGDPMGCGDAAETFAGTVYADGGGNLAEVIPGTPPVSANVGEEVGYTVNAIGVTYSVPLLANITVSFPQSGRTESWNYWQPEALAPHPSNGFRITIEEEFTGNSFISYQSQGAPTLPSTAPPIYLQPLDPFVRFEMVTGPFTIDNAGTLTLIPTFIPPKEGALFVRVIPTTVRIIYGVSTSVITKEVSFNARVIA